MEGWGHVQTTITYLGVLTTFKSTAWVSLCLQSLLPTKPGTSLRTLLVAFWEPPLASPAKIMARAFIDECPQEVIRQQEERGAYRAEKQLLWEMGNLTEAHRHILFPFKDTGPVHIYFISLNTIHPTTDKECFLNVSQAHFRQPFQF